MNVLRDGKNRELEVVLKELPENDRMAGMGRDSRPSMGSDTGGLQGVVVSDIDPQARQRFRIPRDLEGALVSEVEEESVAWESGLRPGDVIREVNRTKVTDAESAINVAEKLENSRILLRIWRQGGNLFLVVDETGKK